LNLFRTTFAFAQGILMAHDNTNPSKRAWKDAVQKTGPATGKRQWQQTAPAPKARRPLSRRARIGIVLGVLGAIVGVLAVLLYLLTPPRPACLVLIGAGYEDNLAIPQNAAGWKGLEDLQRFAEESSEHRSWLPWLSAQNVPVQSGPTRLEGDTDRKDMWKKALNNVRQNTVVVFLAVHGGADEQGPYLLANEKHGQVKMRLEEVFDALSQESLPNKNKVLVLDATQVSADWPSGMFHNDFIRQLKKLVTRATEADPRLWVLCSSDEDQQSWVSEEWQQPIFTHYVLEGLRGAEAASDGSVTVGSLFRYVQKKVAGWAYQNRYAVQTPILLGDVAAAGHVLLVQAPLNYKEQAPDKAPNRDFGKARAALAAAWKGWQKLQESNPHPAVYSPHLWRQYQDLLLRYEQLVLLGDPSGKKGQLQRTLSELERKITDGRKLLLGPYSLGNALPMSATLGMASRWQDPELQEMLRKLMAQPNQTAWRQEWDKLASPLRKQDQVEGSQLESLLRVQLSRALLQSLAKSKNPRREDLNKAATRLRWLFSEGQNQLRPAEVHFLIMLLDPALAPPQERDLAELQLSLRVRLLAEEAALAPPATDQPAAPANQPSHPYSEVTWRWTKARVDKADELRGLGEDWIFGSEKQSWDKARDHLTRAEKLYTDAIKDAAVVRAALDQRDRALAVLPYFAHWSTAGQWLRSADEKRREQVQKWMQQVRKIGEVADDLAARLEAPPKGDAAADLKALQSLTQDLYNGLKDLRAEFFQDCRGLGDVQQQERWLQIDGVMRVPFLGGPKGQGEDLRLVLLRNRSDIGNELHKSTIDSKSAKDLAQVKLEQLYRKKGQNEAIMALTVAGATKLGEFTREQLINKADAIEVWRDSLTSVGTEVRKHWQQRLLKIQQGLDKSLKTADLDQAASLLETSEHYCRWVEGGSVPFIGVDTWDPMQAARRLRMHDLLVWQAERAVADHWFMGTGPRETYYGPAGKTYLKDAQSLATTRTDLADTNAKRQQVPDALQKKLAPALLRSDPQGGKTQHLIGATNFRVGWDFKADAGVPKGVPMTWLKLEEDRPGTFQQIKRDDQLIHSPLVEPPAWLPQSQTYPLSSGVFKQEDPPPLVPEVFPGTAKLLTVYRGQRLESPTDIKVYNAANVIVTRYSPKPEAAHVAVQLAPDSGYGALSIVLDFSGSMNLPLEGGKVRAPLGKRRIDHVKKALTKVLKVIPSGTHLSLLVFGREEETPQLKWIRESKEWTGTAEEQTALINRTFALDPMHTSPVVDAIIQARDKGFPRGFKGPKVLLALTDGGDSEFVKKYPRENIRVWLKRAFYDKGIEVNLVCFCNKKEDLDEARKQFEVFDKMEPEGSFQEVKDAASLAPKLEEALRPKVQLYYNGNRVSFKLFSNDQPVTSPFKGLSATLPKQNLLWGRVELNGPDGQVFKANVPNLPEFNLRLRPGERMLLRIYRKATYEFGIERALFANRVRKFEPTSGTKEMNRQWLPAVLQNKIWNQKEKLEQLLTVENKQNRYFRGNILEHVRPGFFWMEVTGADEKTPLDGVRWNFEHDYPAPAFRVEAGKFTSNDTPRVSAWWIDDSRPDEPAGGYAFTYKRVEDAVGGEELSVGDIAVTVERVKNKESRWVTVGPGERKERSCLVVQLKYAPGAPRVWVQPLGATYEGEEHHFYTKAGRYIAIFWSAEDPAEPARLNLISLSRFKSRANFHARWELPLPDPGDQGPNINHP
jgi:hypothetical protein